MTEPRWNHAYELWREWLGPAKRPQLDRWLARELKKRRYGKRDRRWYGDILFAAVRFAELAVFLMLVDRERRANGQNEPDWERATQRFSCDADTDTDLGASEPAKFFHWIRLRMGDSRIMGDANESAGGGAELLEQLATRAREHGGTARLLTHGFPIRWRDELEARRVASNWTERELATFIERQSARPPVWLLPLREQNLATLLDDISRDHPGVSRSGQAISIPAGESSAALAALREGRAQVQDLASQALGAMVAAQPGDTVWDACAGGGGKTIQLACAVGSKGRVFATDIRRWKLDELIRRARIAGLRNVRVAQWKGMGAPKLGRHAPERFPWVLVDAPCSGTGTWRRQPDGRHRELPADLPDHAALQLSLLHEAAARVAPGGALVYGTCSFAVAEDENVIAAFLRDHPTFILERQRLMGAHEWDSDTLFGALMRKSDAR